MRTYISGKISGIDYDLAVKLFESAEKEVELLGLTPINPIKISPYNPKWKWEDYMEKDIAELLRCDAIYMLDNWETSRGARCELALAKELGINIVYQQEVFTKKVNQ